MIQSKLERIRLQREIYEMRMVDHLSVKEIREKTGMSRWTVYNFLRTFEGDNPQAAEQMKKRGTDITPDDYKKLQEENARLLGELKRERLRADFYEEMVSFGEETYGIDLKKAGTK